MGDTMSISCKECPLRSREIFTRMSSDELAFTDRFKSGELSVEAGTPILLEGSSSPQLYTVLRGFGLRHKSLPDGRRQVINFVFPGDFIGLQAAVMGEMCHSVEATTDMTLCVFKRQDLWNVFKSHPSRAYDVTWLAAREEHFLGETLTTVGRRSGTERVAWALCKLYERGNALGLADGGAMRLPFRQQDLADALGLSLVHTNKTLQSIRKRQVASWDGERLKISDHDALREIGKVTEEEPQPRPLI